MRPTLRLENPIDTSRTLSARRSSASFPGAGGFGWLLAVLGGLAAPGSGAAVEPLLEGRVLLASGQPAAGARVRLFDSADLGRSLRVTTDESGYFALPLTALHRAAPLPARLQLGQNYPNPFNPSTIIPYQLPAPTRVRLEVFNILGQRVATLVYGERPAGFHTATWKATDASGRGVGSGVYLYRLLGGGERLTRSMVLLDGPVVPGGGGSGGAADPWGGGAGADAGSFGGADSWSGAAGTADGFASAGHPPGSAAGGAVSEGAADPSDKPAGARGAGPEKWAPASGAAGAASGGASPAGPTGGTGAGFEGGADPSGRTGGVGAAGFGAWASGMGEGPVYGLTVSGPELVPYVDPAFRVEGGPVEIQVQPLSSLPRGKALAGGGLLGDVDGNGQVDLADALLVVSYSEDPTLSLGNGDLSLGDVNGDGQVDLADARLIEAYHADPSDPSLPEGIGAPVTGGDTTWLYWTDAGSDRIQRSHLDGSGVEDVIDSGLVNPRGLAVDETAAKLYWTDYGSDRIQRSNLDGSEIEDLVTGLRTPLGLALDAAGGKLYWTDSGADKIQRANLDGSGIEDLVATGLRIPRGLALDTAAGKLYWADSGSDRIQRANLDGTEIEDLVTSGLRTPRGLALDTAAGKLYWADSSSDRIQRSNLDGSEIEDLVTEGLRSPRGLALARTPSADNQAPELEPLADRTAATGDSLTLELAGSDPDGDALTYTASSGDEAVATVEAADSLVTLRLLSVGETSVTVIARDPGGLQATRTFSVTVQASNEPPLAVPRLYWTDARTDRIQRAELDGSGIHTLVTGLMQPRDLALDRDGGRMYWTDSGADKIQRAHLDGSHVEDLVVEGLKEPFGIALDLSGGKIYWSDWGTDKIQRSNLDGSQIEDLVATGLNEPYGLALDLSGGKIYWTDWGADKIQRSNLDGSEVEDLVTGLNQPRGIALDLGEGRMYWPDWGTDKIQRANLDGSDVEDLVTEGLQTSQEIALDLVEGRMYWTDYGTDKIQRANLDGSDVEDLVTTGLKEPYGLTLGAGLPAQILKVEGASATLNLTGRFGDPEGGPLTLTATSSDEAVAAASLADSLLTIAPVAPGEVTVSVTARDEGGRAATLPVAVTVYPANRPPVARTLADRKIRIGNPARVELSDAFTDPDETDVLTYTAASSNEAVATAAVEGTGVLITPRKTGQTRISVTARDPKGLEASLSFAVTVEPKPPPRPPRTPPGSSSGDGDGGSVTPPAPDASASTAASTTSTSAGSQSSSGLQRRTEHLPQRGGEHGRRTRHPAPNQRHR